MKPLFLCLTPLVCLAAIPNNLAPAVDMARQAPGEFAADALIRIAGVGKLDKPTRIQLLEEAFRRAAEAQQPFKKRASILKVAGNAGFEQHAYQQNLDALSLRARAVDAMLPLDPVKARTLLLEIPLLELPKVGCDGYMVYDAGLFYQVLGRVATQSFTPKEVAAGKVAGLLSQYAGGIHSAAEVEPVARMIADSQLDKADFESVLSAFSGALGNAYGDDRTYTAFAGPIAQQILRLVQDARKREASPLPLIEGYRLFLVNNLAGQRCADDDLVGAGEAFSLGNASAASSSLGTPEADFFNKNLATPPILPLHEEEVTPSKIEGAAGGLRSCQDAQCQDLAKQYRALIVGPAGTTISNAQRDSAEWRDSLQQFLNSLANWKNDSDDAKGGQFRDKCAFYSALMGVMVAGPDRDRVMVEWLNYLEDNPIAQQDRIEWFLPVNALIGRVALDPLSLAKVKEALGRTRDPVIALYVEVERVVPRTPDQIMPLL